MAEVVQADETTRTGRRLIWFIVPVLVLLVLGGILLVGYMKTNVGFYYMAADSMRPTIRAQDRVLVDKNAYRSGEPERSDVIMFRTPPEALPDGTEREFIKRVVAVGGDTIRITPGYVILAAERFSHLDLRQMLVDESDEGPLVRLAKDRIYLNGREAGPEDLAVAADDLGAEMKIVPGMIYLNGKPLDLSYAAEDPDQSYPSPKTPEKCIVKDERGHRVVRIPQGKLFVMGDNINDSNDSRYWGFMDKSRVIGKATRIISPEERAGEIR